MRVHGCAMHRGNAICVEDVVACIGVGGDGRRVIVGGLDAGGEPSLVRVARLSEPLCMQPPSQGGGRLVPKGTAIKDGH